MLSAGDGSGSEVTRSWLMKTSAINARSRAHRPDKHFHIEPFRQGHLLLIIPTPNTLRDSDFSTSRFSPYLPNHRPTTGGARPQATPRH